MRRLDRCVRFPTCHGVGRTRLVASGIVLHYKTNVGRDCAVVSDASTRRVRRKQLRYWLWRQRDHLAAQPKGPSVLRLKQQPPCPTTLHHRVHKRNCTNVSRPSLHHQCTQNTPSRPSAFRSVYSSQLAITRAVPSTTARTPATLARAVKTKRANCSTPRARDLMFHAPPSPTARRQIRPRAAPTSCATSTRYLCACVGLGVKCIRQYEAAAARFVAFVFCEWVARRCRGVAVVRACAGAFTLLVEQR